MSDKKIRTMVLAAVLAALACVSTMVVQIPSPMNGYVNLGDCFVLLSGWLLGPWWGAAAISCRARSTEIFSRVRTTRDTLWLRTTGTRTQVQLTFSSGRCMIFRPSFCSFISSEV